MERTGNNSSRSEVVRLTATKNQRNVALGFSRPCNSHRLSSSNLKGRGDGEIQAVAAVLSESKERCAEKSDEQGSVELHDRDVV